MQENSTSIPWWIRIILVLGTLLMAAGGVIALVHPALLVSPHDQINGATQIYAGYLASRNLVIAAMLLVTMMLGARAALSNLMVLVGLIQIADAIIDCFEGRWPIIPGILVFGVLFLICAARLSGRPFWRKEAWG